MLLIFAAFTSKSQVYVGGHLIEDITYSPTNNPYIVTQDLIIDPGVTLTILPGVVLDFTTNSGIISNGTLIAKGTSKSRILFRPKNQLPFPGQWDGITFNSSTTVLANGQYVSGPIITNAHISKASYGVSLDKSSSVLVDSCTFERCSFGVFIGEASSNTIRSNIFKNSDFGIFIAGGYQNANNIIEGNRIAGSSDVGIFVNNFPDASANQFINNNYISNCSIGLHLGNYGLFGKGKHRIENNIFTKNGTALLLFHDSCVIKKNYFTWDTATFVCWNSSYNSVQENVFANNYGYALSLRSGSSMSTISYNSFSNNSGGIFIDETNTEKSNYNNIIYNSFYRNSNGGTLHIESAPQGPIQFNNFKANGSFQSFLNMTSEIIHSEYCYWGSSRESVVDSIIFDLYDDPAKGEVLYTPIFEKELTIAPILPPDSLIKQFIDNKVFVSYKKSKAEDFASYTYYYGLGNATTFANKVPNATNLNFWLPDFSIYDTIAVTCSDNQADGIIDQLEGHESCYAFAKLAPYAGPDTSICFNSNYEVSISNAPNFDTISWSSSGDGEFNDIHEMHPLYTPGSGDYSNGYVYLMLSAFYQGDSISDAMKITFHDQPVVEMANDTTIFAETSFVIDATDVYGYDYIQWTTLGDGYFDFDTLLSPTYTLGANDLASQIVQLTCTAFSACGSEAKTITIHIDKGFSVHGRVHAGELQVADCSMLLFHENQGKIAEVKTARTAFNGSFDITGLQSGKYYLYALPDEEDYLASYLPTYYYNDIVWENAYQIPVVANCYDIDIQLAKVSIKLPQGTAMIRGTVTQAVGGIGKCTDVTVFLYDINRKNIFDWKRVSSGNNYGFENLPYGEYTLVGEKTGFPIFSSGIIKLTPQHPVADDVEIVCSAAGFSFKSSPGNGNQINDIHVYPNPCINELFIISPDSYTDLHIRLFNDQGILQKGISFINEESKTIIDVSSISAGVYVLEIWKNNDLIERKIVIKL